MHPHYYGPLLDGIGDFDLFLAYIPELTSYFFALNHHYYQSVSQKMMIVTVFRTIGNLRLIEQHSVAKVAAIKETVGFWGFCI